jgi:superoxide reductase
MENSFMDRRSFLASSAGVAVVAVSLANNAQAAEVAALPTVNVIYTKDNAGRWEAKNGSHLPKIEIAGSKVTITTPHASSEAHFIVRHTLLLANGTVLGAKTFTAADTPVSEYTLPDGYKGKIFATSFCNQHDLWLSETTI